MSLYELSNRYQQLLDQEEYTDEEMQELETLHGDVQEGIVSRAKYIKNLEAEQDAIGAAMEAMDVRFGALEKKIQLQRQRLAGYMNQCAIKEVKSPLFDVKYVVNRASTEIFDQKLIPDEFVTAKEEIKYTTSKDAIKKAIESGIEVPGARLIYNVKVDIK